MITITCSRDLYTYNAYHLARAFFPDEAAKVYTDASQEAAVVFDISGPAVLTDAVPPDEDRNRPVKDSREPEGICKENRRIVIDGAGTKDQIDKEIYHTLSGLTGRTLPWGLLTGVRPTKPAMAKVKEKMGRDEFIKWYGKEKLVSKEKAALAWDIAQKELCILNKIAYQDKNTPRTAEAGELPSAFQAYQENTPRTAEAGELASAFQADQENTPRTAEAGELASAFQADQENTPRTAEAGELASAFQADQENTPRTAEVKRFPSEKNSGTKEPLRAAPGRQAQPEDGAAGAEAWSDTCSIYIGIPFCPGICSYCSFSLGTISRCADKTDAYIDALCREIRGVSKLCGKTVCIYIGGGTPTSLSAAQLERLMLCINKNFKVDELCEFCVEAGRPDTITKEKLSVLKEYGADRISVNPQTMQQKTLDKVGRAHSVRQVYEAFEEARRAGFDNINMDLIAGLPEEGVSDMEDTLDRVLSLKPESLTVHALSIKRRAEMESQCTAADVVSEMIRLAYEKALSAGMSPYYLYRQKSIAGNFENMGYAKPGKEGLYNILAMEEVQTIYGLGAGADTKVVLDHALPNPERGGKTARILRCSNIKDVDGYINNTGEMLKRKTALIYPDGIK